MSWVVLCRGGMHGSGFGRWACLWDCGAYRFAMERHKGILRGSLQGGGLLARGWWREGIGEIAHEFGQEAHCCLWRLRLWM